MLWSAVCLGYIDVDADVDSDAGGGGDDAGDAGGGDGRLEMEGARCLDMFVSPLIMNYLTFSNTNCETSQPGVMRF